MRAFAPVASLLLSTALLLVGHGLQLTILPLRAASLGMPESIIGATASAYFLGFACGCLLIPLLIARAGHIRVFAVLAAVLISAILCLDMLPHWVAWLLLRFLTGVAISGLYTVIESWLNSAATQENRGTVLSVYTFVTLLGVGAGQFLVSAGPVDSSLPFSLAALFIALAILPVGMTRRIAPTPPETASFRFPRLYQLSHSAFAGALLSGVVGGSFWSLGAVFASNYAGSGFGVTGFMIAAIAGGAVILYPVGWLSDRIDRRKVLVLLSVAGAVTSVGVAVTAGEPWYLLVVFLFGAAVLPLYAVALATAADVSDSAEFVETGTSVLLLNALGAVVAPLPLGLLMASTEPTALFWCSAVACVLGALYLLVQLRQPRTVEVEDQIPFTAAATDSAPMAFEMDPRSLTSEDERHD